MIPPTNEDGYLPQGIHRANLEEIAARFGRRGGGPMSIENRHELDNTRTKLKELEQLYAKIQQGPATSEHVRELTLRSLKKRINQFQEEITRFTTRANTGVPHG